MMSLHAQGASPITTPTVQQCGCGEEKVHNEAVTMLLTETAAQITGANVSGRASCQENCSQKFMMLKRGLGRHFCLWPFCTDEGTPNFADFQRKTP